MRFASYTWPTTKLTSSCLRQENSSPPSWTNLLTALLPVAHSHPFWSSTIFTKLSTRVRTITVPRPLFSTRTRSYPMTRQLGSNQSATQLTSWQQLLASAQLCLYMQKWTALQGLKLLLSQTATTTPQSWCKAHIRKFLTSLHLAIWVLFSHKRTSDRF